MTRKGHPISSKGVPQSSYESGEAAKDGVGQPPTQQSNDNKKQGR